MGNIPQGARRVFKGVRYEIYQWQQKMYDGSEKTFEMMKRADTSEAIVTVGDKILIQEEEQPHVPHPFLSLPGGNVDQSETPEAAMSRELLEETGYAVASWELLHTVAPLQSVAWDMHVFIGRNATKAVEPVSDPGEKITPRLVSFEELLDLVDSGALYRFEPTLRLMLVRAKHHVPSREALRKRIFHRPSQ